MENAESQMVRYECVVHKANVPLASGESLGKYTNQLSGDGRTYIMKQLNLNSLAKPASAGAYMIEAFADKAIFDVYKYGGGDGSPSEYKYYALNYTRKADGKFEFKDLTEVERVISFQAKPSMALTSKAAKKAEDDDEDEMEEELSKKPKKTKKQFAPGWTVLKTHVSWNGLI